MTFPRCIGTCRDGSRCGRRVKDAANPQAPLCHLHDGRGPVSPVIPNFEEGEGTTPLALLRRLTRDRDSRVKIRALDLLLKNEERARAKDACPRCASRAVDADVYRRFTDEQMEEARALFQRWQAIKAAAATQPIHPGADYV
jgi:hypothetical protein